MRGNCFASVRGSSGRWIYMTRPARCPASATISGGVFDHGRAPAQGCAMMWLLGPIEDGVVPECGLAVADEPAVQQPAGEHRAGGQHQQRHQHDRRDFVHVLQRVVIDARRAVEGHEQQPPGIERGQERGQHRADEGISADVGVRQIGRRDDRVLGIVAGERWNAGQRQVADPHHRAGHGDQLRQAAHACACPARPTSHGSPNRRTGTAAP